VLGGGLVPGSLVLLGGDPGIGKSTLLLQALDGVARSGKRVLYVSGEESVQQTALRAERLGARSASLMVLAETQLEKILEQAEAMKPAVLAVDSVQTVHTAQLESVPGSLGQVREAAGRLLTFAKTRHVPVILVGHVTKDGALAGPKTLEHVVDAVLYFEGERTQHYRVLRTTKNRFGSTNEIGVFEMRQGGLAEVPNPSALFLAERPVGAPGSVVVASVEGSRPILVEIQALVASSAGVPRRTALGIDPNRVSLLLAVIERRCGIDVLGQDVFVNVAGGVRLSEPAADLGLLAAVASSARGRAVDAHTLCFGEVGLAGEVRAVGRAELRLAEAAKLGFRRCILPELTRSRLAGPTELELIGVRDVSTALDALIA
jgi:DNA repair protein RadA/Sms